jgi:FMN-dependent NADH-azoreductase
VKTLLKLNTSIYSNEGESSRLADEFVGRWLVNNPGARLIARDLAREPVPHLTEERFQALLSRPDQRTVQQQAVVNYSDALIDELRGADVIALGLPLYNFGVPSTLKAYFDHIARAGVTFRYTATGPVGLLQGKKVYVLAARGGKYLGTPLDTQTPYVRQFLGFLGMTDVEFVYAEGLAISPAVKDSALEHAKIEIEALNRDALPAAA